MKTILYGLAVAGLAPVMLGAGTVNGTANYVLGQPDFSSICPSADTLSKPRSVAVDHVRGRVYVADTGNNRVLWWDVRDLPVRRPPRGVLGQASFDSIAPNRGGTAQANTLSRPSGVAVDPDGNVWVADYGNNRIVRYPHPVGSCMSADLVLGQVSFADASEKPAAAGTLHHPGSLTFDPSGNLWVGDYDNHRVVRFSRPFFSAQPADLVLGQQNFIRGKCNDSNGDGVTDAVSADSVYYPEGVCAGPDGSIWVADHYNHRYIRFAPPFHNGMNASCVLGGTDFMHTAADCSGALSDRVAPCAFSICASSGTGGVWVVDSANNRVLRFPDPISSGMGASLVIGQPDYFSRNINRGASHPFSDTLFLPAFVTEDANGDLWVCDLGNNRVLEFDAMKVLSIDVTRAPNTGPQKCIITGRGMPEGATVRLVKAGRPDIAGTGVLSVGESQVRCTFDLADADGGAWDAVVEYKGVSVTLPAALEVVPVKLGAMSLARAANGGAVDATLTGENLFNGLVPVLTQSGQADIPGQYVTVISSGQLACRFDLTDAPTGYWSVAVPPAMGDAVLNDAFQVFFPSAAVRAISRSRAYRIGIETPRGIVVAEIPAGAFAEDCVLSLFEPAFLPGSEPDGFTGSGVAVEIVNDKHLAPQKDITLTFYYDLRYIAGLDRRRLIVSVCSGPAGHWQQAYSLTDANANRVTGKVRHLSIFRIVQRTAQPSLSNPAAAVYPNPYRPRTGGAFDNSPLGAGIVFGGLTPRADIRIFTLAGEQVIEIHETSGSGAYLWDTKNDNGERVASGVYLYLISNPDDGSQKRKGTLSIIR